MAYPLGNVYQRGGFGRGSYGRRGGQITWRTGGQYRGGYQNRGEQLGPARDSNTMDVDRGREEDRIYFMCGKWSHMAKNCWQRKRREGRVAEILQKLAKESGGQ